MPGRINDRKSEYLQGRESCSDILGWSGIEESLKYKLKVLNVIFRGKDDLDLVMKMDMIIPRFAFDKTYSDDLYKKK